MKGSVLVLALIAGMSSGFAAAQPAGGCADCDKPSGCDAKRESCVADCRARLFSIDPKRSECIADCSAKAVQCTQTIHPPPDRR